MGKTFMVKESSQLEELPEGLPLTSLQPGQISTLDNLPLGVVAGIVVIVVGDITPTQAKESLMGTGVENIPSTSDCVVITIAETRSGSTPPIPTPAMDILE